MLTILWHLWISIVFFARRADFLHGHMLTDFYRDFGARKARRDASQNTYKKIWSHNYEVTDFFFYHFWIISALDFVYNF